MSVPLNTEVDAAVAAAVRQLMMQADPITLKRLVRGEVGLAFAERDPVTETISGLPIESAYAALNKLSANELKKYFGRPTAIHLRTLPAGVSGKIALVDAVLRERYGQTYSPPKSASANARSSQGATTKPPRKKGSGFDPVAVSAQLRGASSVDEANALLELGTRRAPYLAIADQIGIEYVDKDTVKDIRAAIVRRVESRLEKAAYAGRGEVVSSGQARTWEVGR